MPTDDERKKAEFADELRAAIGDLRRDDDAIFDFVWDLLSRRVAIPSMQPPE